MAFLALASTADQAMSANYFFLFYSLFVGSTLFLWLLGATFFFRLSGPRSLFHAPWIGLGLLVGVLQIAHLLSPIDQRFSISFVATTFLATLTITRDLERLNNLFLRGPLAGSSPGPRVSAPSRRAGVTRRCGARSARSSRCRSFHQPADTRP